MEKLEDPNVIYNKLQENNLYNKNFKLAKLIFIEGQNLKKGQNEYIISK